MKQNTTNKKIGNDFESFFCELLFSNGFWVHNLAQNQAGQPADVIAARNGKSYLIDCKACTKNGFPFERIEDNQELSMTLWNERGNGIGWFALRTKDDEIYMFSHYALKGYEKVKSKLSNDEIKLYGQPIEEWITKCK